jgi:hypothetical protein
VPERKQILISAPDRIVREVASITRLSYGCEGNRMCLARSTGMGTKLQHTSEKNVFRAVRGYGYLIITLFLLVPED